PLCAVLAGHGDLHEVADLVGREKQVLFNVVVGQAEVGELVVAHGVGTMAAHAVVDEELGPVLQRSHVVDAVGGAIELIATLGGYGHRAGQGQGKDAKQLFDHVHSVSVMGL